VIVGLGVLMLPPRLAFEVQITRGPEGQVELVFEEESHAGSVQVFSRSDIEDAQAMAIDGVVIAVSKAWSHGLYMKQLLLAHLPMIIDREIRHTLNLGVASGSTLKALAQYDQIETLDGVEINPAAVRAASLFSDASVFDDPRTHLYVDDAVNFLLRTPKTYDLIISDAKQHIHFSGNAKVLSRELYQYSLDRLNDCGLFVQFLPALLGSREATELILRTFRDVYPEVEIFMESPFYFITVGSRCPIGGRSGFTREELEDLGIAKELESSFVPDASHLPAIWVGSGHEYERAIGDGPINSWNKLPMEFLGYRMRPPHPNRTAEILAMLLSPRQSNPKGATSFGKDPYFEPAISILYAYLDWLHREDAKAVPAIDQISAENPNLALARRAQGMIHRRIPDTPE
jgi:spermidine synthase